jgi:hypothetical protein
MSKKSNRKKRKQSPSRQFPWLWLAIAGALLLIIGGGLIMWPSSSPQPAEVPEVTGAPRLLVDQTTIDEGYVKLNTSVRTTFRLSNVGDQPLTILGEPQVELIEGC